MSRPISENRIQSLDGLRGLAIVLVVLHHTYSIRSSYLPWISANKDFFIFKDGFLGVELFFIISGFVIYMTLERCKTYGEFLFKRWLRLFPAMAVVSILSYCMSFFLTARVSGQVEFHDMLPGLLFLDADILNDVQNYSVFHNMEDVFWSLYVEVKFYALFGLLYFTNPKTALRNLILLFLLPLFYYELSIVYPATSVGALKYGMFKLLSLQHFGYFSAGALVYQVYQVYNSQSRIHVVLSCLLILASSLLCFGLNPELIVLSTLVFAIFCLALFNERMAGFFSARPFLFFGWISYPLYMLHDNLVVGSTIKIHEGVRFMPDFMTPVPGLVVAMALAIIIARYCEPQGKAIIREAIGNMARLTANVAKSAETKKV